MAQRYSGSIWEFNKMGTKYIGVPFLGQLSLLWPVCLQLEQAMSWCFWGLARGVPNDFAFAKVAPKPSHVDER